MAGTYIFPAISVKICGHLVMILSLARSVGRSRGYVDIVSDAFHTFIGKESHQLLVVSKNLL